ncbi:Oar protein [Acidisarcina polymorpha]|uniref:Oar protein n=1 Tax=Acidisarcina polymorpha TaxID=2211140 RepID=A0A2Z5G3E8_9BACT|nr:TonB-dependent receptor [Acidisarcina polymorpha]AXC13334.1 Oar protein [Acidisarcina polymorpha]
MQLTNKGTNAQQRTATSSAGTYTFINLNPGSYSVTVSHSGFKASTTDQVDVQIGGIARADFALEVGAVTESITVTGATASLQTDNASLGGVIEGRQVQEAPLNGRNVNNLLDFVPGVVPGGGTSGSTVANGGTGQVSANTQAISYGNYQIGGAFSGQSLFFIDGVGSNISENNVNTLVPTQDAVQEFRVSTNNVSAEFGGYGGGVVEISTKSGTNQFHGTAYEYFRNTALDANDWFSNNAGLGKVPLHQNQYGANLGGPLLRNKLFFFFSWEHESLSSATPASYVMPTTAELSGDFSSDPQVIYDPTTGQPFPGNSIVGRIDPVALKILQLETPNESIVKQTPYVNNTFVSVPAIGVQTQYNARVDASLGKDTAFARYTFWNPHNEAVDPFGNKTGAGPTGNYTQEGVLGDNHVFSPTSIAELRLSYLENYNFQDPLSNGFDMATIGGEWGAIPGQSGLGTFSLPALAIQGYSVGPNLSQLHWNNNIWAVNGSFTKIVGKHSIKSGGNWRQVLWEAYPGSGGVNLTSLPGFTADPSIAGTGNALASFLLGIPSQTNVTVTSPTYAFLHNYGFFVEDTYQATPKLTVTAGLRWEQPGAFSEENNIDAVFLPNAPLSVGGVSSYVDPLGNTVQLKGTAALVASPLYPSRREESLHWKTFSPRVGFAWRFDPESVIRAGYGISYFPAVLDQDGPQLSSLTRSATNNVNSVGQPVGATIADPFPTGITPALGHSQQGVDNLLGSGVWARVPDQPLGYSQQWNLAVERTIGGSATASLAYAGSKGTHLIIASPYTGSGLQLNQIPDQYLSMGDDLLTPVANPFYGALPAGSAAGGPTILKGRLLMPYPQYPLGVLQQDARIAGSNYNALQMYFTKRFGHAGIVQAAYTWAKLISDTDNTSSFLDGQGGTGLVQDRYNLKAEKSVSQQDIRQNFVANYGLDLPFGHGQMYLANINSVANALVGGWRVNGITTLRSGVPIALTANPNTLAQDFGGGTPGFGLGSGIIRPNYAPGCSKSVSGNRSAKALEWFNTSCFSEPGPFEYGNESRVDTGLRADKLVNFDFSANKSFDLTERAKLKFSAEIFDLFNHPQFAEPGVGLGPSFGVVNHQSNLPRTVQLALRFTY